MTFPALVMFALFLPVSHAAPCSHCGTLDKMAAEFHQYDYTALRGSPLVEHKVDEAIDEIKRLERTTRHDPERVQVFTSLLNLAREACIYETEGDLSSALGSYLAKNPQDASTFDEFIKSKLQDSDHEELCKTMTFQARINENTCKARAGIHGQDSQKKESELKNCIKRFNFDNCLAEAK